MEQIEVYAVATGDYSDKKIHAVFTEQEHAKAAATLIAGYIENIPLILQILLPHKDLIII